MFRITRIPQENEPAVQDIRMRHEAVAIWAMARKEVDQGSFHQAYMDEFAFGKWWRIREAEQGMTNEWPEERLRLIAKRWGGLHEIEERLGVSTPTVSRWVNGAAAISRRDQLALEEMDREGHMLRDPFGLLDPFTHVVGASYMFDSAGPREKIRPMRTCSTLNEIIDELLEVILHPDSDDPTVSLFIGDENVAGMRSWQPILRKRDFKLEIDELATTETSEEKKEVRGRLRRKIVRNLGRLSIDPLKDPSEVRSALQERVRDFHFRRIQDLIYPEEIFVHPDAYELLEESGWNGVQLMVGAGPQQRHIPIYADNSLNHRYLVRMVNDDDEMIAGLGY